MLERIWVVGETVVELELCSFVGKVLPSMFHINGSEYSIFESEQILLDLNIYELEKASGSLLLVVQKPFDWFITMISYLRCSM